MGNKLTLNSSRSTSISSSMIRSIFAPTSSHRLRIFRLRLIAYLTLAKESTFQHARAVFVPSNGSSIRIDFSVNDEWFGCNSSVEETGTARPSRVEITLSKLNLSKYSKKPTSKSARESVFATSHFQRSLYCDCEIDRKYLWQKLKQSWKRFQRNLQVYCRVDFLNGRKNGSRQSLKIMDQHQIYAVAKGIMLGNKYRFIAMTRSPLV